MDFKKLIIIILFFVAHITNIRAQENSTPKWQLGFSNNLLWLKKHGHFFISHQISYRFMPKHSVQAGLAVDLSRRAGGVETGYYRYGFRNSYFIGHKYTNIENTKNKIYFTANTQFWWGQGDIMHTTNTTNYFPSAIFLIEQLEIGKNWNNVFYLHLGGSAGAAILYNNSYNVTKFIKGGNLTIGMFF